MVGRDFKGMAFQQNSQAFIVYHALQALNRLKRLRGQVSTIDIYKVV